MQLPNILSPNKVQIFLFTFLNIYCNLISKFNHLKIIYFIGSYDHLFLSGPPDPQSSYGTAGKQQDKSSTASKKDEKSKQGNFLFIYDLNK